MPFDLCRIGQLLKSAREEKGLTYDEVATALFIRKRVIGAIEAGDWESLPHPVYVRGYVSQYASYLKIMDMVQAAMLPAVEQQTPVVEQQKPVVEQQKPVVEQQKPTPVVAEEAAPESVTVLETQPPHKERQSRRPLEPKKKVIAAVAMGAVVVGFFVFQNLPKHSHVVPPAQVTQKTTEQSTPTIAATAAAAAVTSPYQAVETTASQVVDVTPPAQQTAVSASDTQKEKLALETKKLTIACQERTWVRIIIDGTEEKEYMLNPEEQVILNAKEGFDLLIGNAAGVKLIYNGKDVGLTGQAGEVKHINLS